MKKQVLTAGLVLMFAGAVWAQQPAKEAPAKPADKPAQPATDKDKKEEKKTLTVGDKAPALAIEKWVKGEPVTGYEKGRVYVVEFWATWCGPCIASMPHLTETQKEYKGKGVTVIGVTSKDSRGNNLESVEKMVKEKGDEKMGYTVGYDKDRTTNKAFMEAAGQNGIPCAYIINQDGIVAYIGHPMNMDEPLKQIVEGKYDLKAAAEKYKAEKSAEENAMADQQAVGVAMAAIQKAIQDEKWDEASKLLDAQIAKVKNPQMATQLAVFKFKTLLEDGKQYDKAYAFANEAMTGKFKDDAMLLNSMAWMTLDDEGVEKRDIDLALKLAQRANDLTKQNDGMYLDTLAYAHFMKGDAAKALEIQKKAVELSKTDKRIDDNTMDEMKERLAKFEKAVKEKH